MVHQAYKGVNILLWAFGGIMTGTDAIEFMMAGAQAVKLALLRWLIQRLSLVLLEKWAIMWNNIILTVLLI